MPIAKRTFGRPPSLDESLARGKLFTDAAMELPIQGVLDASPHKRALGRTAASLAAKHLQQEGDYDSKRLVFAAYDGIYDLMRPTLTAEGSDTTVELFNMPMTRMTILALSRSLQSQRFSDVARRYATRNDFLAMTDEGLAVQPGVIFPRSYETEIGGCPYAKSQQAPYFNQFTSHIITTYAHAYQAGMPHGRLEQITRSLRSPRSPLH